MEGASAGVFAKSLVRRLRERGHQAFLVGGCVRDLLLHRPVKDYDVATSATPEEVISLFPGAGQVGAHFGVVLVRGDGHTVEVATFRTDEGYQDGRHPERVLFQTDPKQDVLRRDFTINALLLDPDTGDVIDYAGGRADLERGIIRTVGEAHRRFQEDHLRMLRAVRFAARLGFAIEPETMEAIQESAPLITTVSAERIRDELTRILTEGGARRGFELLDESLLLQQILPEIAAMKGVEQPPEYHPEGDVWTHTLIMLEGLREPDAALAWGVLLHDVGKPPTFRIADRIRFDGHVEVGCRTAVEILTRLHYPNDLISRVEALVANHMRFGDVHRMKESTLKRFIRQDHIETHLELHRLDCLSSHGSLGNYDFVRQKLKETPPEQLRPPRLVTGEDLIRAGYQPGPGFKKMLEAVESAQLEGRIRSTEEGLELVKTLFGF